MPYITRVGVPVPLTTSWGEYSSLTLHFSGGINVNSYVTISWAEMRTTARAYRQAARARSLPAPGARALTAGAPASRARSRRPSQQLTTVRLPTRFWRQWTLRLRV